MMSSNNNTSSSSSVSKASNNNTNFSSVSKASNNNTNFSGGASKVVKFRTALRNTILDVFRARGYVETPHVDPPTETNWDVIWADRTWVNEHFGRVHLSPMQKVNHFRNYYELTRKDHMVKNLKRTRRKVERRKRNQSDADSTTAVAATTATTSSASATTTTAAAATTPPNDGHNESVEAAVVLGNAGSGDMFDEDAFTFFPETFQLPGEYIMFTEHFRRNPNVQWIMKPIGRSQGRGIFLVTKLSQVNDWKHDFRWSAQQDGSSSSSAAAASASASGGGSSASAYSSSANATKTDSGASQSGETSAGGSGSGGSGDASSSAPTQQQDGDNAFAQERYVVQQYISNPLLVGGKKFDMRLYALVTSYQPLVVWVHREGFARFSSARFSMSDMNNTLVHLTNVAVQKHSDTYDEASGGKWDVRHLKLYLIQRFGRAAVRKLFAQIQDIILISLQSVQPVMINDKRCFELYGYDIMIDDKLKPWLIEVNAAPSLTANTKQDYNMKFALLEDMLTIVMDGDVVGPATRVGGFDLVYRGRSIRADEHAAHSGSIVASPGLASASSSSSSSFSSSSSSSMTTAASAVASSHTMGYASTNAAAGSTSSVSSFASSARRRSRGQSGTQTQSRGDNDPALHATHSPAACFMGSDNSDRDAQLRWLVRQARERRAAAAAAATAAAPDVSATAAAMDVAGSGDKPSSSTISVPSQNRFSTRPKSRDNV